MPINTPNPKMRVDKGAVTPDSNQVKDYTFRNSPSETGGDAWNRGNAFGGGASGLKMREAGGLFRPERTVGIAADNPMPRGGQPDGAIGAMGGAVDSIDHNDGDEDDRSALDAADHEHLMGRKRRQDELDRSSK
jgi:hypothetical protein